MLNKCRIDQVNFVLHLGIGRHGDRVFEHNEGQVRVVQRPLLCLGNGQEGLSNDAHRGNAGLFEVDGILETPGGAAASLADPGDRRVSTGQQRFEHVLSGGAGEERFLRIDDFLHALALLQQLPK